MQHLYCPECKSQIHPESGSLIASKNCHSCSNRQNSADLITWDDKTDSFFFPDHAMKWRYKWFNVLLATSEKSTQDEERYEYFCPSCKNQIYPTQNTTYGGSTQCQLCQERNKSNNPASLVIKDKNRRILFFTDSAWHWHNEWGKMSSRIFDPNKNDYCFP